MCLLLKVLQLMAVCVCLAVGSGADEGERVIMTIAPHHVDLTASLETQNVTFTCNFSRQGEVHRVHRMQIVKKTNVNEVSFKTIVDLREDNPDLPSLLIPQMEQRAMVSGNINVTEPISSTLGLTLDVDRVLPSDEGIYRCSISFTRHKIWLLTDETGLTITDALPILTSVAPESITDVNPTTERNVTQESVTDVNPTTETTVTPESVTDVNPTTETTVTPESVTDVNPTTETTVTPESVTDVNPTNDTGTVDSPAVLIQNDCQHYYTAIIILAIVLSLVVLALVCVAGVAIVMYQRLKEDYYELPGQPTANGSQPGSRYISSTVHYFRRPPSLCSSSNSGRSLPSRRYSGQMFGDTDEHGYLTPII